MTGEWGKGEAYYEVNRQIGARLKTLRMSRNCDIEFVAKVCALSVNEYSKMEAGLERLSPLLMAKVGELFGVDVGWFFDGLTVEGQVDGVPHDTLKDKSGNEVISHSADVIQFPALRSNRRA